MDHEETHEFLNNALSAAIDPHAENGNPEQVIREWAEAHGLDVEALRCEAREALFIGALAGKIVGDTPAEMMEAVWCSAFHYGWVAAEAMEFKKMQEARG